MMGDDVRKKLEELFKYLQQYERAFPHSNPPDCEGVIVGLEGAISTATAIIEGLLGGKHDKRMDKFLTKEYR